MPRGWGHVSCSVKLRGTHLLKNVQYLYPWFWWGWWWWIKSTDNEGSYFRGYYTMRDVVLEVETWQKIHQNKCKLWKLSFENNIYACVTYIIYMHMFQMPQMWYRKCRDFLVQALCVTQGSGNPDPATSVLSSRSKCQVSSHSLISFLPFSLSIPLLFINYCVCRLLKIQSHTSSLNFSPCFAISRHLGPFPASQTRKRHKTMRLWFLKCVIGVKNGTGMHLNYCFTWHSDN